MRLNAKFNQKTYPAATPRSPGPCVFYYNLKNFQA
jgi:hypothetical protein